MATKTVKLKVKHADFPEKKFPGGILSAEYDAKKNVFYAKDLHGNKATLFPDHLEPLHDIHYEEKYQATVKKIREEFDKKMSDARAQWQIERDLADKQETELKAAQDAAKKAEKDAIAAEKKQKADAEKAAKEKEAAEKAKAVADAQKNAQAIADACMMAKKEYAAIEKKVSECEAAHKVATDKLEAFTADEKSKTPEAADEYKVLAGEVEIAKTALENAQHELERKGHEVDALKNMNVKPKNK